MNADNQRVSEPIASFNPWIALRIPSPLMGEG
jgi:hypothetical protein